MVEIPVNAPKTHIQLDSAVISDEVLFAICESVDVIACECPGYLARLMRQVQAFRTYTIGCMDQFPDDRETHEWLSDRAQSIEQILSQTILELMDREGLINEQQQLCLNKLSERARETALKQIGMEE